MINQYGAEKRSRKTDFTLYGTESGLVIAMRKILYGKIPIWPGKRGIPAYRGPAYRGRYALDMKQTLSSDYGNTFFTAVANVSDPNQDSYIIAKSRFAEHMERWVK